MTNYSPRTDLATEARTLAVSRSKAGEISGVDYSEYTLCGLGCQELIVRTVAAAAELGKPLGNYFTIDINPLLRREDSSFENAANAVAEAFKKLVGTVSTDQPVLVAGLGNRDITPDSVGPIAASHMLVTRHLKSSMPDDFRGFSPVSVIAPGVLGTSGIESFDYIKSVAEFIKPSLIVAVDALASRGLERLCTTIQLTDSGISPGSGVGNSRPEISRATMAAPVVAVGVPTVVDLRTVVSGIGEEFAGEIAGCSAEQMIVTPRSIDTLVLSVSRAIAYGLNLALHPGLTISDIDMLLC